MKGLDGFLEQPLGKANRLRLFSAQHQPSQARQGRGDDGVSHPPLAPAPARPEPCEAAACRGPRCAVPLPSAPGSTQHAQGSRTRRTARV